MIYFRCIKLLVYYFFKVAYIVAENKRRNEINEDLLAKLYIDQEVVTIHAIDRMPADTYLDQKLPYTQTGNVICNHVFSLGVTFLLKGDWLPHSI